MTSGTRLRSRLADRHGPARPGTAGVRAEQRDAGLGGLRVGRAPAAAPQFANWPTFHGNRQLTGVSGDPAISALNAGQLGVRWMTHTFGPGAVLAGHQVQRRS